jgi:hypothetical protein
MADFEQNVVPTFTRLVDEDLGRMEKRILRAARHVPIGVIIPALFNDLSSPAMQHIIAQLAGMNFVKRIYISLAQLGGRVSAGERDHPANQRPRCLALASRKSKTNTAKPNASG